VLVAVGRIVLKSRQELTRINWSLPTTYFLGRFPFSLALWALEFPVPAQLSFFSGVRLSVTRSHRLSHFQIPVFAEHHQLLPPPLLAFLPLSSMLTILS
jgi:hypothetical protein